MGYVIWTLIGIAVGFVAGAGAVLRFFHKKTDGEIWGAINVADFIRGSGHVKVEPDYMEDDGYGRNSVGQRARRGDDKPDPLL